MEQFCADPAKAEALRRNAQRVYRGFPKTVPEMLRMGYHNADAILGTPIVDAPGVAAWVDSIFNSCCAGQPAHPAGLRRTTTVTRRARSVGQPAAAKAPMVRV